MSCILELAQKYEEFVSLFYKKLSEETPHIYYSERTFRKFLIAYLILEGLKPSEISKVEFYPDTVAVKGRFIILAHPSIYSFLTSIARGGIKQYVDVTRQYVSYICKQLFNTDCRTIRHLFVHYCVCRNKVELLESRGISIWGIYYHRAKALRSVKGEN